jgi:phosphatidylserine/phosphatidylglycerophosphate/cardiolipin synthase-like enzyme
VLQKLQTLSSRPGIFSYGVTQAATGLKLYKPGSPNAVLTGYDYLHSKVPPPFNEEWRGGPGQVIHHKFVVVDFNDMSPVVFTGSSNLAQGGEEANGDNLLAIHDRRVATIYAVEAIRLVDHYHFRSAMSQATAAQPLALQGAAAPTKWWERYYDKSQIQCLERQLFSR